MNSPASRGLAHRGPSVFGGEIAEACRGWMVDGYPVRWGATGDFQQNHSSSGKSSCNDHPGDLWSRSGVCKTGGREPRVGAPAPVQDVSGYLLLCNKTAPESVA